MTKTKNVPAKVTNGWDALIAFGNGFFNLLKIEKIVCLVILYMLGRDAVFSNAAIKAGIDYNQYLIDQNFLQAMLEACDGATLYIVVIICLIVIIAILIGVIVFVYKKEVDRLSDLRSELMHDKAKGTFATIKKHNSSK